MARIMSLNYSRQGKHRRLWRLAVATQPTIAGHQSAPCPEGTRIYQKPTASSEGAQLWDRYPLTLSWFRKAGQTIILNIIGDASVPLRGTQLGGIIFTHSCAASQLAVGFMIKVPLRGIRSSYSICLRSSGAWLRRDAIASYVCYGSLWLSSNKSQFAFVVLSPLRYENLFFMSSCQKHLFFMSSCQKYTSSCPPCKYRTKSKNMLQNKN